jgi:very-short-patch-repair endonuclease
MDKSKQLRKEMTPEELRLWYLLRGRRFAGYKFRRQMPVGAYIVDFACFKAKLIIELDGGQHQDKQAYDSHRSEFLKVNGWKLCGSGIMNSGNEEMLMVILQRLRCLMPSPNLTLSQGEGG